MHIGLKHCGPGLLAGPFVDVSDNVVAINPSLHIPNHEQA